MVVAAFPLAKLAVIAIRQISKPLSIKIKERAKSNLFFRTYICMPPAQFYHWVDINIKMKMLNLGKPSEVQPLNESMAIDLGAELLGEATIFCIAVGCMMAEYIRSSRKESRKEQALQNLLDSLQLQIKDLGLVIEEQDTKIRELSRPFADKLYGGKLPEAPPAKLIEIINKPIEKLETPDEIAKKEHDKCKVTSKPEPATTETKDSPQNVRSSIIEKAIHESGVLFVKK